MKKAEKEYILCKLRADSRLRKALHTLDLDDTDFIRKDKFVCGYNYHRVYRNIWNGPDADMDSLVKDGLAYRKEWNGGVHYQISALGFRAIENEIKYLHFLIPTAWLPEAQS